MKGNNKANVVEQYKPEVDIFDVFKKARDEMVEFCETFSRAVLGQELVREPEQEQLKQVSEATRSAPLLHTRSVVREMGHVDFTSPSTTELVGPPNSPATVLQQPQVVLSPSSGFDNQEDGKVEARMMLHGYRLQRAPSLRTHLEQLADNNDDSKPDHADNLSAGCCAITMPNDNIPEQSNSAGELDDESVSDAEAYAMQSSPLMMSGRAYQAALADQLEHFSPDFDGVLQPLRGQMQRTVRGLKQDLVFPSTPLSAVVGPATSYLDQVRQVAQAEFSAYETKARDNDRSWGTMFRLVSKTDPARVQQLQKAKDHVSSAKDLTGLKQNLESLLQDAKLTSGGLFNAVTNVINACQQQIKMRDEVAANAPVVAHVRLRRHTR